MLTTALAAISPRNGLGPSSAGCGARTSAT